MRRLFWWQLLVLLLLAGAAVGAQIPNSNQNGQYAAAFLNRLFTPSQWISYRKINLCEFFPYLS